MACLRLSFVRIYGVSEMVNLSQGKIVRPGAEVLLAGLDFSALEHHPTTWIVRVCHCQEERDIIMLVHYFILRNLLDTFLI